MKTLCTIVAAGLSLVGAISSVSAQPYGGRDYGYDRRDDGYRDRGDYDRDRGFRDRDFGERDRRVGFNEREYLRCNPDVLRAVRNGTMESGLVHFQTFGRRERRRLQC